jgi:hypothetical protein
MVHIPLRSIGCSRALALGIKGGDNEHHFQNSSSVSSDGSPSSDCRHTEYNYWGIRLTQVDTLSDIIIGKVCPLGYPVL